jgi:hypothetical protein
MTSVILSNYKQQDKSQANTRRNMQTAGRSLALKTVQKVDDPELQKFQFQQVERMSFSTFFAELIGNAGQRVRFKLSQTLDEALRIAVTVFEAEAQEIRKSTVLMLAQVVENLVTLISSRELAYERVAGRCSPVATERQTDSQLSKYIAHYEKATARLVRSMLQLKYAGTQC